MSKRGSSKAVTVMVIAQMIFLLLISFSFIADSALAQDDIKIMLPQDGFPFVELDSNISIPAVIQNTSYIKIGGFTFLIQYDTSAMELIDVDFSPMDDCNWDYRQHAAEAANLERIVAATYGSGCNFDYGTDTLFYLQFHIKPDSANDCMGFPIRFYWIQCSDNTLTNTFGDSLLMSDQVFDIYTYQYIQGDDTFPTIHGVPDSCVLLSPGSLFRLVDFYNGLIEVACNDAIDNIGDINLNEIPFEIADYVLFQNYYISGPNVFDINLQAQLDATDCNKDGVYPTLRDLVFMYRVIIGDITPLPKMGYDGISLFPPTALFVQDTMAQEVHLVFPNSLSAIHLIFNGEIVPTYSGPEGLAHNYDGEVTRILVSPGFSGTDSAVYQGLFFTYTGDGILDSCDVADWEMRNINSTFRVTGGEPMCGDVDASGTIDIVDGVYMLNYIFYAGEPPLSMASADVNCDLKINILDAISIFRYVFLGYPVPCGNCP
jgi:hypothetical protein